MLTGGPTVASGGFTFVFLLVFPFQGCCSTTSPILIVPGILGNQLEAKLNKEFSPYWWCSTDSDWYTVWISMQQLVPYVIDCWVNNTRLLFRNGEYFNCDGVEIRAPGFGDTGLVEFLDAYGSVIPYFYYFVDFFTKHGYVRGASLRAAPYDWRLTPDLLEKDCYYDDVQQLIETMYRNNGNTSVTIVTHSMGSPVILYFLAHVVNQKWKDKYLKAFVPLSGVWKGSVKTLVSIVTGDPQGIPGVPPSTVRHLQRSSPATYFLLPIPEDNVWNTSDPVVVTPDKNYTLLEYSKLFSDLQYSVGYSQFERLPSFLRTFTPPNVDTYCYYGIDIPTPLTLVYGEGEFPDIFPSVITGNGDGMVNDVSLQACSMWKQAQSHKVDVVSFSGIDHVEMVKDSDVLEAILDIVSN